MVDWLVAVFVCNVTMDVHTSLHWITLILMKILIIKTLLFALFFITT